MHIKYLKLLNFKNYSDIEVDFCPKFNCFTGLNGVGKTNILDALYYLSFTKSYFNNNDKLHIKKQQDFFKIEGNYVNQNNKTENLTCIFTKEKGKVFKQNDKPYKRYSDHIGKLPSVVISPDDTRLITGTGEERRKFINSVISQYDKEYLQHIINYKKILQQRNTLLKIKNIPLSPDDATLDIYDFKLNEIALVIHKKRTDFINSLRPIFEEYYNFIADEKEQIKMNYTSSLNKNTMYDLLKKSFEKDRILQYTYHGIHRDDIDFFINDLKISKSGSQGQQKTFLIALKLAQYDFLKKVSGKTPILLLDDIFDKFDNQRVRQIIQLIRNEKFGQIFITDTCKDRITPILSQSQTAYKLFEISDNNVNEIETL